MKNFCLLLGLIIIPFFGCYAGHIQSANIGYKCLGNQEYKFTIEVQRDCFGPGGSALDEEISVAIYNNGSLIHDLDVMRGPIIEIPAEDYENCMATNFNVCREKANYVFQANLPFNGSTYTIAYQRCCWALNISNLEDPSAHGITITTDLSPLAQTLCNSQEITELPISFLACPNTDVSIPLPPLDSEGDSLVYEVCLPFAGAGTDGASTPGDPLSCVGVVPSPACPPPYEELEYVTGYDHSNPFPTNSGFQIINNNLEFSASTVGYYISGLCITEYRNGELLSSKRIPFAIISRSDIVGTIEEEALNFWQIKKLSAYNLQLNTKGNASIKSISIFDISGRTIGLEPNANDNSIFLNISHLKSGIYIIKIQQENNAQLIKFFKP